MIGSLVILEHIVEVGAHFCQQKSLRVILKRRAPSCVSHVGVRFRVRSFNICVPPPNAQGELALDSSWNGKG